MERRYDKKGYATPPPVIDIRIFLMLQSYVTLKNIIILKTREEGGGGEDKYPPA